MPGKEKVVAVALSGGIDSLVSGHILKKKFDNVFGIHFTTGYERVSVDLENLEKQLGFSIIQCDLAKQFEKKVVTYFVDSYIRGLTPNPCVICNRDIKFGALLEQAVKEGADYIATGHYAGITDEKGFFLQKGRDRLKEQSYFLSMVPEKIFSRIIFPLADMTKKEVVAYANTYNLQPLHKKESQDICFIHDKTFAAFIQKKAAIAPSPGNIINQKNQVVGRHEGLHRFTIGQRRGINCPAAEPYYVKQIDMKKNELQVCFKNELAVSGFAFSDIVWNGAGGFELSDKQIKLNNIITRIRYAHPGASSTVYMTEKKGRVEFETPQNAVTPGQIAVFYQDENVLGAGIIR